jgi:hypothetical protein
MIISAFVLLICVSFFEVNAATNLDFADWLPEVASTGKIHKYNSLYRHLITSDSPDENL